MTEGSGGTGLHKGSLVAGGDTFNASPSTAGRKNGNGPVGIYNHALARDACLSLDEECVV